MTRTHGAGSAPSLAMAIGLIALICSASVVDSRATHGEAKKGALRRMLGKGKVESYSNREPDASIDTPQEVLGQSVNPQCGDNQFLKTFDNSCMDCDVNCEPGECVDTDGCNLCLPGFFRSRPDPEWPFTCVDCAGAIANCAQCTDGIFDAFPATCEVCSQGFVLVGNDRCEQETISQTAQVGGEQIKKAPEELPGGETIDIAGQSTSASASSGSSSSSVEGEESSSAASSFSNGSSTFASAFTTGGPVTAFASTRSGSGNSNCSDGTFLSPGEDGSCTECDPNCKKGMCLDIRGCAQCKDGFFTSRADSRAALQCQPCDVANCAMCRNFRFDILSAECIRCASGFRLQLGTNTCEAIAGAGDVPTASQSVPGEFVDGKTYGKTEVEFNPKDVEDVGSQPVSVEIACGDGEFLKQNGAVEECMACDANCVPGKCMDMDGCVECKEGFFTSRPDMQWPMACKECGILNCRTCRGDIFDAWPIQCVECFPGFLLGPNRESCVVTAEQTPEGVAAGGDPTSSTAVAGQSVGGDPDQTSDNDKVKVLVLNGTRQVTDKVVAGEIIRTVASEIDSDKATAKEEPQPSDQDDTEVAGQAVVTDVLCPAGSFLKTEGGECMACDPQCGDQQCLDLVGCELCKPGFFRSRADELWPFECRECDIANCEVCRDGIFDAWPVQCERCSDGFELINDRKECVERGPAVAGQMISNECADNQFLKTLDQQCMDCDENCLPGECVDGDGCNRCREGFFRSRPDEEWPFLCRSCQDEIPNCSQCRDGIFDAWPVQCERCIPGFVAIDDGKACAIADSPGPGLEVGPQSVPPARCAENQFFKTFDQECMDCDENCLPGECVDGDGCNKCKEGYFRSRPDAEWPFTCRNCKEEIPDCNQCRDGIFDAWPVTCED